MAKQGFKDLSTDVYAYQEIDSGGSVAIGLDNTDGDKLKVVVSTSAGANPSGTAQLTIDSAAAGDITFKPNGTGSFVINNGGTDTFILDSDGFRNMALQPCFMAYNNTARTNQTGDATPFTIPFEVQVFDQGSDYVTSGTFTAPITGRYKFTGQVCLEDFAGGATLGYINIVTSNRTILGFSDSASNLGINSYLYLPFSVLTDMDATDTVHISVVSTGGTKTVDMPATAYYSYFSGELVC